MNRFTKRTNLFRAVSAILIVLILLPAIPTCVFADGYARPVSGKLYSFGDKGGYQISKTDTFTNIVPDSGETYGVFKVSGDYAVVGEKNGVPQYQVQDGTLQFYYNHSDILLKADIDSDHLCSDEGKKVDGFSAGGEIGKGIILIQTSKDRLNWVNSEVITDAFSSKPVRMDAIYSAKDVELINGCYYRVIIAYKLEKRVRNSNFLFIDTDKFEYKHIAEVYEFYAETASVQQDGQVSSQMFSLGKVTEVKYPDGYYGTKDMTNENPHNGWDLGQFYVSGYTEEKRDASQNNIFLKNVGDKVTLWFKLNENINKLRGNENLKVAADPNNYDRNLGTNNQSFGKGMLFICHTDRNNNKTIIPYENYLEANTAVGADTKVQLCEEGDYEVALNYKITKTKKNILGQKVEDPYYYRISFKFSVRNGNCMVYPFDVTTGAELTNSSMTANGFRLDLAKSLYLNVTIRRDVMTEGADGLVEDTRFNRPARDGEEYTDEGIYTITVNNEYTGAVTVKKIYVGTNRVLRAHMVTGLTIPQINDLVARGATIDEDGTIRMTSIEQPGTNNPDTPSTDLPMPDQNANNDSEQNLMAVLYIVSGVLLIVGIIIVVVFYKKRQKSKTQDK